MSKVLTSAILREYPGARRVHVDGEYAYIDLGDGKVTRYRLSKEAKRVALLEREGRPLDIPLGEVRLLAP